MLHSNTPLIVAIITEGCRIWEQSTVSYHQKKFVDFHSAATQIFTECFNLVQIYQHNGNYRIIPFYWYVQNIGILLCWHAYDVMFMGCNANLGTQKNYAFATLAFGISDLSRKVTIVLRCIVPVKGSLCILFYSSNHCHIYVKSLYSLISPLLVKPGGL